MGDRTRQPAAEAARDFKVTMDASDLDPRSFRACASTAFAMQGESAPSIGRSRASRPRGACDAAGAGR